MRIVLLLLLLCSAVMADELTPYEPARRQILEEAMRAEQGYQRLVTFCDAFGPRITGSESLERSIDWLAEELEADGFKVWTEPVKVPHWVRGRESLDLLEPHRRSLPMLGLGFSVATPPEGIEGEVVVVESFAELDRRRDEIPGKIVLFDVPFTTYGTTVVYRADGASRAARHGAVAALLRSVTPFSLGTPHTGMMRYEKETPKIPFAAIAPEDAAALHRAQTSGQTIKVRLQMEAQTLPWTDSRNLIAEWPGSEKPEEMIVLGGHIDSWDVGQGAQDDAGGCFVAWEAVRLLKSLGLRPKRTLRVVMWTAEENSAAGANAYDLAHLDEIEKVVLAIESDSGIFAPRGFSYTGNAEAEAELREILKLLEPLAADGLRKPGGGVDIGPLMSRGVPGMGLWVEGSRYFWYHHSPSDTVEKVDRVDFQRCVAAIATLIYVVGDKPTRLPFGR